VFPAQDYDGLSVNTFLVTAFIIQADWLYFLHASNVPHRNTHVKCSERMNEDKYHWVRNGALARKRAHDKELAVLNKRHVISARPVVNLKTDRRNVVRWIQITINSGWSTKWGWRYIGVLAYTVKLTGNSMLWTILNKKTYHTCLPQTTIL